LLESVPCAKSGCRQVFRNDNDKPSTPLDIEVPIQPPLEIDSLIAIELRTQIERDYLGIVCAGPRPVARWISIAVLGRTGFGDPASPARGFSRAPRSRRCQPTYAAKSGAALTGRPAEDESVSWLAVLDDPCLFQLPEKFLNTARWHALS